MALSERQLEAMRAFVFDLARTVIADNSAASLKTGKNLVGLEWPQPLDSKARALLAVESEETPAPRKEAATKAGIPTHLAPHWVSPDAPPCPCEYCVNFRNNVREASAPATRSVESLLWDAVTGLERRDPGDHALTIRQAVTAYREERAASRQQILDNSALENMHISACMERDSARRERDENASEAMRLQGELSEARERIEKALAHMDVSYTLMARDPIIQILRGEEKPTK